jgi:hypothetical protein
MSTVSPDDMFSGGMVTMHMYTITWDGGSTRFPHLCVLTDAQAIQHAKSQGRFPGANPKVSVESTTSYREPTELKTMDIFVVKIADK